MVKAMTAAITGLRSHQSKMDVISNNIANVNTWGFKSRSANFQDSIYQNLVASTGGETGAGDVGGVNSSQLGYGVNVGSISTNFALGSWGYTGNGLDCMIDGTGFFIVGGMMAGGDSAAATGIPATNLGTSSLNLSRVGIFSVDNNGYIVDNSGNYLYGFDAVTPENADTAFKTDALQPIQIPFYTDAAGNTVQYQLETVRISTDGTIVGVTSDNTAIVVGQIAVASVENVSGLEQTAGYMYSIGDNAGNVNAIPTVATTTGKILSGYLEMSNVDLATDMASMITTQRGYQANSKIITVTDEMLEQLVNMKR